MAWVMLTNHVCLSALWKILRPGKGSKCSNECSEVVRLTTMMTGSYNCTTWTTSPNQSNSTLRVKT